MAEKYKITYNIKIADTNSDLYGILVEQTKTFNSLQDAMSFIRNNTAMIVGKPILERK